MLGVFSTTVFGLLAVSSNAQKLQDGKSCRVATFLPFQDLRQGPPSAHADSDKTFGYGTWPNATALAKASFSLMAASEMARLHFNERNPILVPELESLGDCDIQIPDPLSESGSWILDSGYDRRLAVETFLNRTAVEQVCAIIGPVDDYVAQGLSPVAESMRIPLIGFSTLSYRLSLMDEYPTFARVIPEAYDFGVAVTKYFERDVLEREVAGIIYDETDYGEQFESPIEELEDEYDYLTITESFTQGQDEGIRYSLQEALDKGFRTIVLVTDQPAMLDDVARVADEMGMIGDGYFWIISGGALPPAQWDAIQYEIGSPTDRMLRGAALFTNYDNFMYLGEADPFLSEWRKQTLSISRLVEMAPLADIDVGANYFKEELPAQYASFIYDAVIAAGISACAADSSAESAADTSLHFTKLLETSFKGGSGMLRFKTGENENGDEIFLNSRDANDVTFGMYNIRAKDSLEKRESKYEFVLTHLYSKNNTFVNPNGETEYGAWKALQGTEFLFHDGTSNEPMPRRETADAHYISR